MYLQIDEDLDGTITKQKLYNFLISVKPDFTLDDAIKILRNADFGGNGNIEYSEFCIASMDKNYFLSDEKLK